MARIGIIFAELCTGNLIRGNLSYDNDGHGIMLHESSDGDVITGNLIHGNSDGISIFESSDNLVTGNVTRNNLTGIRVYGRTRDSSDNTFADNDILGNANYGVFIYDAASGNLIEDNRIHDSGLSGVYLKGTSDNAFIANSIRGSDFGVRIDSAATALPSTGNRFQGNTINGNRSFGIYSYPGPGANQVGTNRIFDNRLGDVHFAAADGLPGDRSGRLLLSIRTVVLVALVAVAVLSLIVGWRRRRAAASHG